MSILVVIPIQKELVLIINNLIQVVCPYHTPSLFFYLLKQATEATHNTNNLSSYTYPIYNHSMWSIKSYFPFRYRNKVHQNVIQREVTLTYQNIIQPILYMPKSITTQCSNHCYNFKEIAIFTLIHSLYHMI